MEQMIKKLFHANLLVLFIALIIGSFNLGENVVGALITMFAGYLPFIFTAYAGYKLPMNQNTFGFIISPRKSTRNYNVDVHLHIQERTALYLLWGSLGASLPSLFVMLHPNGLLIIATLAFLYVIYFMTIYYHFRFKHRLALLNDFNDYLLSLNWDVKTIIFSLYLIYVTLILTVFSLMREAHDVRNAWGLVGFVLLTALFFHGAEQENKKITQLTEDNNRWQPKKAFWTLTGALFVTYPILLFILT